MRREPILTALGASGRLIHINDAIACGRYMGAAQDHQDCELYPVLRSRKRSSFAYLPGRGRADAHRRGQSAAHWEACSSWFRFFQKLIGECGVCRLNGVREDDHLCPARNIRGELVLREGPPLFGEIVWVCDLCLRVHMWDLLDGNAARILRERQAPGLSVRPDITIVDEDDRPIAFIEFHASHLSAESREVADREGIPLFVIDVERTLDEVQMGIQNPRRGMWQAVSDALGISLAGSQAESYRWADEANYNFTENIAQEGGVSGGFCAVPDREGDLVDVFFHVAGHSPALPMPSIGHYLLASWSSLQCESQYRWLGEPVGVGSHSCGYGWGSGSRGL